MDFGISTACFYPSSIEDSLSQVISLGYKNTEIFFNTYSEYSDDFISQINNMAKSYGVNIVSAHPYTSFAEPNYFFSDYPRRYRDGIELYKYIFHQTAKTGCRFFQFHGAFLTQNILPERYAEVYIDLKNTAADEGLILSQENVGRCLCGKNDYLKSLVDILGNEISFTLDLKQACRSGEKPIILAETMKNINMVHINDRTALDECLLPCMGDLPLSDIKNKLSSLGFDGIYMTEVYSKNFNDVSEVLESKNRLEKLFTGDINE